MGAFGAAEWEGGAGLVREVLLVDRQTAGSRFRIGTSEFRFQSSGFRVQSSEFRVQSSG